MTLARPTGLLRLAALGVLASTCTLASAFSFSYTSPVQCDDITVSWTGGTAPFSLLVTPHTTEYIDTSQRIQWYTWVIYDNTSNATGVGSGGTSGILTAGTGDGSCNTTDSQTDFVYSLDRSLQQCRPYIWSHYEGAVQPITITGLIPLGKTFILNAPLGDSYTWMTNIAAGTNVVFVVVDAQGRQGGSTDLYTVGSSDDNSCVTNDSPGSTAQSGTSTSISTATSTPSSTPTPASQNTSATVIGSSIAGGAVFLVAAASLIWFFLIKNGKRRPDEEDDSMHGINASKRRGRSLDLLPDDRSAHSTAGAAVRYPLPSPQTGDPLDTERGRSVYDPDPYVLPPPPPPDAPSYFPRTPNIPEELSESGHTRVMSNGTSTIGMSKAQAAAAASASASTRPQGPQRFIMHTDAGELDDDDVVELPPMYTQVQPRRTPARTPPTDMSHPGPSTVDDPWRS
ncbi:hypothetical protein BN14_00232 [Rhizoctonia solani AG-1 IB]|uniref:Alphaherpesvirus glycoprotein E domain-containing protein n=1 Tax=Thanatephorus cucumeris (strain AG1-IB / isolate 7/3/14) TaxID=1108050 RepID=M5BIH0_THACB|nr:hypothetical protein BN14_00232 [Rhizoctonia solani AG-1 IB]